MKNIISYIGAFLLIIIMSCQKQETDFRNFFDGHEIVYTGSVGDVVSKPGNLKTQLKWKSSTDPTIIKYIIYWNNNRDSQVVNITGKTDSVVAVIENLQEFAYSFTIYSYDAAGNKSIPKIANNVKIYGPTYQAGLLNRAYNATDPYILNDDGSVQLNFNVPDTINISTTIKYTNTSNIVVEKELGPNSNSIVLPNYKLNTEVQYRSSYIPGSGSLDIFTVSNYSTFPPILSYVLCDKSLFKESNLPGDIGTYESGTSISKLWDGSVGPQDYPNLFHSSDNGAYMPHVITFDMGKIYDNLGRIEETGRTCCGNPDKFEVWGIADLTNAVTNLRADDSGWKNEMEAKGWTLLREVVRTDSEAKVAMKFDFIDNPAPVRYIRIRVTHTVNGGNTSNISELTFWNKQ